MNEDSNFGNIPSHDHSFSDSHDYLSRAQYAVESGDRILGIHLYLAAFEQSILENIVPSEESVNGMRAAWDLAVDARQHSLAEYIFEKLKPFVSAEELSRKADQLQDVALDRLEEFGFSREAIEDMAEMINDDLFNLPPDLLYRYEDDNVPSPFSFLDLSSKRDSASDESDAAPTAETSDRAEEVKAEPIEPEQKEANPTAEADEEPLELPAFPLPNLKGAKIAHIDLSGKKKKKKKAPEIRFDYSTIHGFSRACAGFDSLCGKRISHDEGKMEPRGGRTVHGQHACQRGLNDASGAFRVCGAVQRLPAHAVGERTTAPESTG